MYATAVSATEGTDKFPSSPTNVDYLHIYKFKSRMLYTKGAQWEGHDMYEESDVAAQICPFYYLSRISYL